MLLIAPIQTRVRNQRQPNRDEVPSCRPCVLDVMTNTSENVTEGNPEVLGIRDHGDVDLCTRILSRTRLHHEPSSHRTAP